MSQNMAHWPEGAADSSPQDDRNSSGRRQRTPGRGVVPKEGKRPQIIRGRRGMPRAEVSNIGRDQQVNENLLDWDKNRHKGPGVTERKTISEGPKDAQMT